MPVDLDTFEDFEPPLFVALKRPNDREVAVGVPGVDALVQIQFDETGAYLSVINRQGRPIDVDYRSTHGALRDLLKSIGLIHRRQRELVGWDGGTERIYLHQHEHLLWPLGNCEVVVDSELRPITFETRPVGMVLDLVVDRSREPAWITGQLSLVGEGEALAEADQVRFLNETRVLVGQRVYMTQPLGENFSRLTLFNSRFPEPMLDRCLALLFSHFTGVTVRYQDYSVTTGDPLPARTAMLFEQVDQAESLHFILMHMLPGYPVEFTRHYEITRVAVINDTEHSIMIREITYASLEDEHIRVNRALAQSRPS